MHSKTAFLAITLPYYTYKAGVFKYNLMSSFLVHPQRDKVTFIGLTIKNLYFTQLGMVLHLFYLFVLWVAAKNII